MLIHFRSCYIGVKRFRQMLTNMFETKDEDICLTFLECCINTELFEAIHHFQETHPTIVSKRFSLCLRACRFRYHPIQFMMTNVVRLELTGDNKYSSEVVTKIVETNLKTLRVLTCFEVNLTRLPILKQLCRLTSFTCYHCNFFDDVNMISQIVEHNPWLQFCEYRDWKYDSCNKPAKFNIPFQNIQFQSRWPFPSSFAAEWDDVERVAHDAEIVAHNKSADEYNRNVRWIRFVVGMMQWAHQLQFPSFENVLLLDIVPWIPTNHVPSWWTAQLFDRLLRTFHR